MEHYILTTTTPAIVIASVDSLETVTSRLANIVGKEVPLKLLLTAIENYRWIIAQRSMENTLIILLAAEGGRRHDEIQLVVRAVTRGMDLPEYFVTHPITAAGVMPNPLDLRALDFPYMTYRLIFKLSEYPTFQLNSLIVIIANFNCLWKYNARKMDMIMTYRCSNAVISGRSILGSHICMIEVPVILRTIKYRFRPRPYLLLLNRDRS